jgi:hypothetical protein
MDGSERYYSPLVSSQRYITPRASRDGVSSQRYNTPEASRDIFSTHSIYDPETRNIVNLRRGELINPRKYRNLDEMVKAYRDVDYANRANNISDTLYSNPKTWFSDTTFHPRSEYSERPLSQSISSSGSSSAYDTA